MTFTAICDYDGTLTNEYGKLSECTSKDICRFLQKNHLCILTHTEAETMEEILTEHKINCDYFSITSQQGKINNTKIQNRIPLKKIQNLLQEFNDDIYTAYTRHNHITYIYHYQNRLDSLYGNTEKKDMIDMYMSPSHLILAISKDKKERFCFFLQQQNLSYSVLGEDQNRILFHISQYTINKNTVLELLKQQYPFDITVGIGDSTEDWEFIQNCDIKVAMKNGEEKLKRLCSFTTEPDNTENGCMDFLLKL